MRMSSKLASEDFSIMFIKTAGGSRSDLLSSSFSSSLKHSASLVAIWGISLDQGKYTVNRLTSNDILSVIPVNETVGRELDSRILR